MKAFRLGEASGLHFADEHAPAFPQLEFIGEARRQILHIEAELDFSACLGERGDHGVVSTFNEGDVQHQALLIADDLNLCRRTREQSRHDARKPVRRVDHGAVDTGQDVAGFDAGCRSRVLLEDFVDQHPFAFVDAELACQLHRERLDADAQPASCHPSLRQQLLNHLLGHVGGNRKTDPLGEVNDGGIDADDFAAQVEERAARVAGIDRRVRLNEIFVAREIDVLPADPADDAERDRPIESERIPHGEHPLADAHGR